ncbi:histone-like nucleoid-structuring protein, MvaT/MvaU family [Stutzerimonas azotifigens]|uniref:histone-like nucleoid-structuring protein, MvaT/MvaU family n=1 Tax=Stutzerimonas azotifigens TaxID=291995 RepID=UPI0004260421|nr:histone-like nucleoid-structuring protein, MvaT/MvaU family [Stutzerimonas azotifigens]
MSRLAEFRRLEEQLARQLAELENLKNDRDLKKEIEFEEKLRELMREYDMGLSDIKAVLGESEPRARSSTAAPQQTRRARRVKRYTNPHTGETVETKGGNHKVLKAWKQQYGDKTVESWVA